MYKNIAKQEKLLLKNLVDYQAGQVVSKTLVQNELVSVTVFSFEKDEEISTHASGGDAMVTVLEGTGLSMTRYFAGKVLQAALSALLAWGAWHVMTAVA